MDAQYSHLTTHETFHQGYPCAEETHVAHISSHARPESLIPSEAASLLFQTIGTNMLSVPVHVLSHVRR